MIYDDADTVYYSGYPLPPEDPPEYLDFEPVHDTEISLSAQQEELMRREEQEYQQFIDFYSSTVFGRWEDISRLLIASDPEVSLILSNFAPADSDDEVTISSIESLIAIFDYIENSDEKSENVLMMLQSCIGDFNRGIAFPSADAFDLINEKYLNDNTAHPYQWEPIDHLIYKIDWLESSGIPIEIFVELHKGRYEQMEKESTLDRKGSISSNDCGNNCTVSDLCGKAGCYQSW